VTQPPLLINELERIARERGWSNAVLAERIGVSVKSFYNLRLGHSPLSLATLSRIHVEFGARRTVRELVSHFLATEYPASGRDPQARVAVPTDLPEEIPYMKRWRLAMWAAQMSQGDGARRGLYVVSTHTDLLSAVVRFLQREAERSRSRTALIAASTRLSASHAAAAVGADLLIIERVDHIVPDIAGLLEQRRSELPTVVTSVLPRHATDDPHLLRVFRSTMANFALDPAPPVETQDSRNLSTAA
jgi:transcriptional regulator with XRE-family HTH domain